ncbi:MAG TPA: VOC family protein, partial [Kaistiaceae bacterium]|nr:VOC family protein [Kaistiaceae bacterium]
MTSMAKVRTSLWFDGAAEAAANFYVSLLPGSELEAVHRVAGGNVAVVEFTLAGTPYQAFDGGPQFPFTEAASISVLHSARQARSRSSSHQPRASSSRRSRSSGSRL